MENLLNSIKAVLYERTSSPLFGALFVSWLAWNYRTVFVLFSELPVADRFQYVQDVLYPNPQQSVGFLVLLPTATALIYLFLMPYPARWVHRFWRARQKELRDDRLEIEGATQLTVEESRQIRQSVIDIQSEYDRALRQSESEIERIKALAGDHQQEIERLEKELADARATSKSEEPGELVDSDVISKIIRTRPYRLFHNPEVGRSRSKMMMFGPSGKIIEGGNNNENSWTIKDGKLELVQADGKVHTRFTYHPKTHMFLDTNDDDTGSRVKGKFMVPEPAAAEPQRDRQDV